MKKSYFIWNIIFTTTKFMAYLVLPSSVIVSIVTKSTEPFIAGLASITILLGVNKVMEPNVNKSKIKENENIEQG